MNTAVSSEPRIVTLEVTEDAIVAQLGRRADGQRSTRVVVAIGERNAGAAQPF
jgi:hypothetical protein